MADPWQALGAMRFDGRDGAVLRFVALDGPAQVHLALLEDDVVRLRLLPWGQSALERTWAVVGSAGDVGAEGRSRDDLSVFSCPTPDVRLLSDRVLLSGARISVEVTLAPFGVHVGAPNVAPVLHDHASLAYRWRRDGSRGVRHTLSRQRDERYYGLGESSGPLDRHHRRIRLRPGDALGYSAEHASPLYKHLPIAFTLTPTGEAAATLYDSGAEAVFDFGSEVDHYVGPYRYAEFAARELDMYHLMGPKLSDVVRRLQDLTGYAPLPPRWTLGYLGSTMRYTDAEDPAAEFAGFVAALEAHGISCSGFHLSSGYSLADDGQRYVFEWNRRRVPEPTAMLAPLTQAGIRTLANVKPALLDSHPAYAALAREGLFVRRAAGDASPDAPYTSRFWGGDGSYLDFTDPRAYAWWQQRLSERILDAGIDASWNDNNEFQVGDDDARCRAGAAGDLRPTLTLLMNHASRAAQRQRHPQRRDYQVTRSGGIGTHRYAQTWSGDNHSDWNSLAFNLPMGLSLSLCGWANHGHDVGGFAGPPPDAELLVRWIEHGVAMPRFTIHSWNDDGSATEPWTHPEVLPLVQDLMRLRHALVPYLATLQHAACSRGEPLTQPLVYAFQDWRPGWDESFVHMLGPALLVAPVVTAGADTRSALLPPGRWLELASGLVHLGDRAVELQAPLGTLPLLLREGHALPLAALETHEPTPAWLAGAAAMAPDMDWLAFPRLDGSFAGTLWWDDGETRAHEHGAIDRYVLRRESADSTARLEATLAAGFPSGRQRLLEVAPSEAEGSERLPWFGTRWQARVLEVTTAPG